MSTKYTLRVKNDSLQTGSICVYQTCPDQQNNSNIYSLAWFTKAAHPETSLTFSWTIDYSMVWSETGELVPGVMFDASESRVADLQNTSRNILTLSKENDAFLFKDAGQSGQPGMLTIKADGSIPNNTASVGIGMGGKPAIALNAFANMNYQFIPHPTYWVAFGDFKQGKVIDVNRMSQTQEIVFGPNIYEKSITFNESNTWQSAI